MAKKNKTKYIFECTGPDELTQFSKAWNRKIEDHCERDDRYRPTLMCLQHEYDKGPCRYLKIHTYKGDK